MTARPPKLPQSTLCRTTHTRPCRRAACAASTCTDTPRWIPRRTRIVLQAQAANPVDPTARSTALPPPPSRCMTLQELYPYPSAYARCRKHGRVRGTRSYTAAAPARRLLARKVRLPTRSRTHLGTAVVHLEATGGSGAAASGYCS